MGKGGGSSHVTQYEPVKSAEQAVKEAQDAASRTQKLRQGIMGTFSRATVGAGRAAASTATSGTAAKLGGN